VLAGEIFRPGVQWYSLFRFRDPGDTMYKRLADNRSAESMATRLRRHRFRILLDILAGLPKPVSILDIGGTQGYWEMMGLGPTADVHVTILNVYEQAVTLPRFAAVVGDARSMPQYGNRQFDVVFSNSTIEHVGDWQDQREMAREIERVGKYYYVQTPNRMFPVEPHFLFPGFQFLPIAARTWLLQHFDLGWHPRTRDYEKAREQVAGIRLLSGREMRMLFPRATLYRERLFGLTKSYVAHGASSVETAAATSP
jgi:hypothetical protein